MHKILKTKKEINMSSKFGRNSKLIMFLVAEYTEKQSRIIRLFDIIHGLTTLYNVRLTNEKTLYTSYIQESYEKLIVILFNQVGLDNRTFRECVRTLLAAKLDVIGILDESMTKERVLSSFSFNNKRKQLLEDIVTKSISFEKDKLFRAAPLVERIQSACCHPAILNNSTRTSSSRSRTQMGNEPLPDLLACLKSQKVVLKKPVLRVQPRKASPFCSSVATHSSIKFPPFAIGIKQKPCSTKHHSNKSTETPKNGKVQIPLLKFSSSSPKHTGTTKRITLSTASQQQKEPHSPVVIKSRKFTYPTIEISQEGSNTEPKTPEHQDNMPWSCSSKGQDVDFGTSTKNNDLDRRSSFDYIAKTYFVCDPTSKKTFYVNFPTGIGKLKRDSISEILRRSSLIYNSSRVNSPSDEINLDYVIDSGNFLESPIPSPVVKTRNFIYPNPLPAFSDAICFPPLEKLPSDMLQLRRPSLFDVLLH